MATIANAYDPNDPNKNANQGGGGTVMPSTGASGGASGGGGPSSSAQPSTPYQPPNVSQYLNANQGAGSQLTKGITGNIQSQANQLGQNVNKSQNQLNAQYNPLSENLGEKAQSTINTAFQNPQSLLDSYNASKAQSSSQPLTSDQQANAQQYGQFQQLNTGGYNPAIQNYGALGTQTQNQLMGQLGNITQQTGAANNEMGRAQLLQNTVGQGNYSPGQQTLDSLFLQGSPGQRNAAGLSNLQQLQQNLKGIGGAATAQVGGLGQDTQSKLAALQGLSAADQSSIKNLFLNGNDQNMGLNQIGSDVAQRYAQAQATVPGQQATAASLAAQNKLTPEQLEQFGLHAGTQTWGVNDLTPYLTNNALTNNAQTATPEEFARYNALNQLAGGPAGLQASVFGSAQSAGGYTPVNFNTQQFNSDVAAKQAAINGADYKNALNNSLAGFNFSPASGGGFKSTQGGVGVPLATQVMNGLQAGTLNPQQAYEMIQSGNAGLAKQYGLNQSTFDAPYQSFLNYYNNEYAPAAASTLGQRSPDANPLPMDWTTTLPNPTGGAGKGAPEDYTNLAKSK